jgi:hypothetical protein
MRCCRDRWVALAQSHSVDNLEALIRGLTVAESSFQGWQAGSVSPVIWAFVVFERRAPARAGKLADWVLAHTDNHYLPFGSSSFSARSRDKLALRRREYAGRQEVVQRAEAERAAEARERRAAKATKDLPNAVRRGDLSAIDGLLEKGADPRVRRPDGASMLDLARQTGQEAVIARIEAAIGAVSD